MASLSGLRDGLKDRLATISGLRAHDTVPDAVNPPAAVVGYGEPVCRYDLTMGGGATWLFKIRLFVGRVSDRTAQDRLDAYISDTGASSVYAALEADDTLGGVAHSTRVIQAGSVGAAEVGGVTYLICDFDVEVLT